jgi:multidrug efflux system membrane fusion protein
MRLGPILALILVAGAGYGVWRWIEAQPAAQEQAGPGRGGRGGRFAAPRGQATPVSVAPVRIETTPITREGIGNVQARQAVTVRAQVDGPLLSVEFVEGQMVKAGEVLARIDPAIPKAALDQALAKKMQDEANLANARVDLQRYRALAASNAGPKQQADQQAATVAQLAAQVKADEAAVANAQTTLGYTTIVSPLDGRIGLRQIDPGNIVHASDANGLVTIAQVTPIDAVFTLPQRDLALVVAAQAKGPVPVDALASGGGVIASGRLAAIDNAIDVSTGTIKLKASFPNADTALWPGQFVNVRVTVDQIVDARVVPAQAVRRGPDGTFVYVLSGEDTVTTRLVRVLVQDESRAALAEGVDAGEKVVTVGFARLSPGAKVTVAPDVSAPAAGPTQAGGAGGRRGQRGSGDGAKAPGVAGDGADAGAPSGGGRQGASGAADGQAQPGDVTAPRGERRGRGEGRRRRGGQDPAAPEAGAQDASTSGAPPSSAASGGASAPAAGSAPASEAASPAPPAPAPASAAQ